MTANAFIGNTDLTPQRPEPAPETQQPTSLYRYYDRSDILLYVGITSRGTVRNREHNATKEWWRYVVRQEVTHLPDRATAATLERTLIQTHRPPFNTQHNPDAADRRSTYLALCDNPSLLQMVLSNFSENRVVQLSVIGVDVPEGLVTLAGTVHLGNKARARLWEKFRVQSGGRKAHLRSHDLTSEYLLASIWTKHAQSLIDGRALLRWENKDGGYWGIKRIELRYDAPRTRTQRRRTAQKRAARAARTGGAA